MLRSACGTSYWYTHESENMLSANGDGVSVVTSLSAIVTEFDPVMIRRNAGG